jgi:transglutaminase-like putative cysteine protease
LTLDITSAGRTRTEVRTLDEPPALMLSLARRLAGDGLREGLRHRWTMFDPATMRNAPVDVAVGRRELVRANDRPVPAFRVELSFAGLRTTSWVTDTGEVVREKSPMGLLTVAETEERAISMAVPRQVQLDLLAAAAIVPQSRHRIDEPRDVRRLRLRLEGADLSSPDLQGSGQTVAGDVIEIVDPRTLRAEPDAAAAATAYLGPEPLIESDAPEIREEAARALGSIQGTRARAERLTRYVNALVDKKPTVSLPSALDVLRTRVGDCNEHTALYVALARASGIPARISVGLASVRNAFYYHAWPEVFVDEGHGAGAWLPVDPTFNQFPADATHIRLARGGLDKQAAIVPLIGRVKITILDLDLAPDSAPALVGRP